MKRQERLKMLAEFGVTDEVKREWLPIILTALIFAVPAIWAVILFVVLA